MSRCPPFLALLSLALIGLGSCSDRNDAASALMVETRELIQKAEDERDAEQRLEQLERAEAKLQLIVGKYPSTDIALELTSGRSVGEISLAGLQSTIRVAETLAMVQRADRQREQCFESPSRLCVSFQALAAAQEIEDDGARVRVLVRIAEVQSKAGHRILFLSFCLLFVNVFLYIYIYIPV